MITLLTEKKAPFCERLCGMSVISPVSIICMKQNILSRCICKNAE